MSIIPYLQFAGNANQALAFYTEEVFENTTVKQIRYNDMPQNPDYPLPAQEQQMIMEASLAFCGGMIMLSDVLPSMVPIIGEQVTGNQVIISLVLDDHASLQRYFERLAAGGRIMMPLSSQPWSACFGMLVDRFGVTWKFNSDAHSFLDRVLASKIS